MNYKKLVQPDTFIGQYMQYMSNVETAESYDFWCACWAIGTGVNRGVFVDRPSSPIYLNWYIILAAEAGITRKSTAISSIRPFVEGHCPILTGRTSPESLDLLLHECTRQGKDARAAFAVSELVTVMGKEGYLAGMPGLLTDIYDCEKERRIPGTMKSGPLLQKNVYVSFLSASTPAWLVTAINPAVIEGGFTSRVMFIVDDTRKKAIAWPQSRAADAFDKLKLMFDNLIEGAQHVGPIGISDGGLKKFTRWYGSRHIHNDPFQSSFEAREDDHVLRLASMFAINDGTYELQSNHIAKSIQCITDVKDRANTIFGGDISTKARVGAGVARARDILIDAGVDGIKHSDLHRRMVRHIDATELRLLMDIMHECGMIQIFDIKKGGKMYRATRTIEKFGVASEVLAKLNLG